MRMSDDLFTQISTELIRQSPSDFLLGRISTQGQLIYLAICVQHNQVVADYWFARKMNFSTKQYEEVDSRWKLATNIYTRIKILIDYLFALWEVVLTGWKYIKAEWVNECQQLDSAEELFYKLLRFWFDNDFAVCLLSDWEQTVASLKRTCAVGKTNVALVLAENKNDLKSNNIKADIRYLTNKASSLNFDLHFEVFRICNKYSSKNPELKYKLHRHDSIFADFCRITEPFTKRKRSTNKFSKLHSLVFIEGDMYVDRKKIELDVDYFIKSSSLIPLYHFLKKRDTHASVSKFLAVNYFLFLKLKKYFDI